VPAPKYSGSVLKALSVSTPPELEVHAEPVVIKMTLVAVLVKPAHGTQLPAAGTAKSIPMKLEPPLPKPPPTAMQ
jgi:hypothetical protein